MQPRLELGGTPRPEFPQAARMARTHQEHVALPDDDALRKFGRLEVTAEDVLAGLEPGQSAETRDVEQDASPDQAVREDLDRTARCASGRHGTGRTPVVEQPLVRDVAERVDMRVAVMVVVGT